MNSYSSTYKAPYGALYNWFAVNTRKLCPAGWHVLTDNEWTTLATYLEGDAVAGGKLKEIDTPHWTMPNTGATNEKGFTALPSGDRYFEGTFFDIEHFGNWWSTTEYDINNVWYRYMSYNSSSLSRINGNKKLGLFILCIKNN
jgi:uncharacterized protein (TIGR02145 family)